MSVDLSVHGFANIIQTFQSILNEVSAKIAWNIVYIDYVLFNKLLQTHNICIFWVYNQFGALNELKGSFNV